MRWCQQNHVRSSKGIANAKASNILCNSEVPRKTVPKEDFFDEVMRFEITVAPNTNVHQLGMLTVRGDYQCMSLKLNNMDGCRFL